MSSSLESEYWPMNSLALSGKTTLPPREAAFLDLTNELKSKVGAKRVSGIKSDDPSLLSEFGVDWKKLQAKIAGDPRFDEPVDTLINIAATALHDRSKYLTKEEDKESTFVECLRNLRVHAQTDERGCIEILAESPDLWKLEKRLQDRNNSFESEEFRSAVASNRSTWKVDKISPIRLEKFLSRETLESFVENEREKVPALAKRLTEQLKSYLSEDPELLKEKHRSRLLASLRPFEPEEGTTGGADRLFQRFYPRLDEFLFILSKVKIGPDSESQICTSIEDSLNGIIDRKAESGYPEMGLSKGVYLDFQLNPKRLEDTSGTECYCIPTASKTKLGQDSVQFQIKAMNNALLHGIVPLPSVDLSTALAVEDREPFNITDI